MTSSIYSQPFEDDITVYRERGTIEFDSSTRTFTGVCSAEFQRRIPMHSFATLMKDLSVAAQPSEQEEVDKRARRHFLWLIFALCLANTYVFSVACVIGSIVWAALGGWFAHHTNKHVEKLYKSNGHTLRRVQSVIHEWNDEYYLKLRWKIISDRDQSIINIETYQHTNICVETK